LKEVTAQARSGYLIVIDQCERCGGIWCDRWELFPMRPEEADRLDPIDTNRFYQHAARSSGAGNCPRCSIPLQRFRDPLLPADARIERCRHCDGMWLNRGELRRFKQSRRSASSGVKESAVLVHLARSLGAQPTWAKVSQLNPGEEMVDNFDDIGQLTREVWRAGAWAVLRVLLRLLLRV
jgi:Zn-finger nucleic acid-binding protein